MASEKTVQPETLRYSADAGNAELSALCGPLDENLRQIETILNVRVSRRGDVFRVTGELEAARRAVTTSTAAAPRPIPRAPSTTSTSRSAAATSRAARPTSAFTSRPSWGTTSASASVPPARARPSSPSPRPSTPSSAAPSSASGERLGFLPGDLTQKVDPYLRPLYDALFDLMGFEKSQRLMERQSIEVAPLAYMRGRTLNNAFVILDEAQNTTPEQMKMFLTRIGFGSKAVITGDVTQIDLPKGVPSGLKHAIRILDGVRGIEITRFTSKDVVRHPLVARIVDAYEEAAKQDELAAKARKEVKE